MVNDQLDDLRLVQAIAAQDGGALGMLYDRYGRLVYSLALHVLGESNLAEEVTQDVFVQVWSKANQYRPEQGKLISWITGMARHRAIDIYRRIRVRPEGHRAEWLGDDPPENEDDLHPEQSVVLIQEQERLRRAIAQLPPDQQEALALAYFQGLSHQQIAEALSQPLGTVKTRLRLAMQKLKQALAEDSVSER